MSQQNIDKYITPFKKKLENPGLVKMIKIMSKSKFLIPWMLTSLEPLSWDIAFGWGKILNDKWQKNTHHRPYTPCND